MKQLGRRVARFFVLLTPFPDLLSSLQGPFVFFFRIVFNKEARNAMKYCCSRKRPEHMIKSKAAVSPRHSPQN